MIHRLNSMKDRVRIKEHISRKNLISSGNGSESTPRNIYRRTRTATVTSSLVTNKKTTLQYNQHMSRNISAPQLKASDTIDTIDTNSRSNIVNDNNQTFFDLMTQQPSKFTHVDSSSSDSEISISWKYDNIIL